MGGPSIGYGEMFYNEFNYNALKRDSDVLMMDSLIEKYKDVPIKYGKDGGDAIAVICHTSGTSNGTRKPLPYTDRIVNSMASGSPLGIPLAVSNGIMAGIENAAQSGETGVPPMGVMGAGMPNVGPAGFDPGRMVVIPPFDFSSSSNINGFVNTSFASGNTIVTTFFGFLHPKFVRCLKYYGVHFVNISGFMIDVWMKQEDVDPEAFSSVKLIGLGGSYISPAKYEKYEKYLKEHGFKGMMMQGYGMSELAGDLFIVPPGAREDIIGFPDNIDNFRIFDETDGKFHKISEGEREGIIYGRSDSMSLNELDGQKLFELTEIDGMNYTCMNDVIHVNADGSLSYVGRSNKYFVNNEGIKFDSGVVETQLSMSPNIELCAVVPVLDKRIHDTVPVLYVVPSKNKGNGIELVRNALREAYIDKDKLKGTVLPTQFIIVDDIPLSASGKIDVYHITRSRLEGDAYNIIPVKKDGELVDINLEKAEQLNSYTAGKLPEGMGQDSSFNIFDIFTAQPEMAKLMKLPRWCKDKRKEHIKSMKDKMPEIKMPEFDKDMHGMPKVSDLPKSLQNFVNVFSVISADQIMNDSDYED